MIPENYKVENYLRLALRKCRLTEYLDRTGKHLDAKTFNKHKDEIHSFSEWEALII